jgi:hypothetical protein
MDRVLAVRTMTLIFIRSRQSPDKRSLRVWPSHLQERCLFALVPIHQKTSPSLAMSSSRLIQRRAEGVKSRP